MTIYRRLFWSGGWTSEPGECADCDVPIAVGDEVAWRQEPAYQVEVPLSADEPPAGTRLEWRQNPPLVKHRRCAERERRVRIFEPCRAVGEQTFSSMTEAERAAYLAAWDTPTEEPVS